MTGAGLIDIKRRIKSVSNTKKITKAMSLISTTKLRRVRIALTKFGRYQGEHKHIVNDLVKSVERIQLEGNIYTHGNGVTKPLYIVMTSDTGLCGGFNGLIVSEFMQKTSGIKDKEVILVGQKGRGYLRRSKVSTKAEYVEIPDLPTENESTEILRAVLRQYKAKEIGEVYLVYTKFKSTIRLEPVIEKVLPFEVDTSSGNIYGDVDDISDESLEKIFEQCLNANILMGLFNSKASEQASRMTAMEGATKNASEIITNLSVKYNRIRQGIITQEISEIVGGAEAQK